MRATNPGSGSTVRRPRLLVETASRYDFVLAVIPLAFVTGGLLGTTHVVPDLLGVAGGSVVALAVTAYALLVSPPIDPASRKRSGSGGGYLKAD